MLGGNCRHNAATVVDASWRGTIKTRTGLFKVIKSNDKSMFMWIPAPVLVATVVH